MRLALDPNVHQPRGMRQIGQRPGQNTPPSAGTARDPVAHIAIPFPHHGQIDRKDQHTHSKIPRTIKDFRHDIPVTQHVELKPEWLVRYRSDFLERTDRHCRKRERHPRRIRRAFGLHLGPAGQHPPHPDRSQSKGHRSFLASKRRGSLNIRNIPHHTLLWHDFREVGGVLCQRGFAERPPIDIVKQKPWQLALGNAAIIFGRRGDKIHGGHDGSFKIQGVGSLGRHRVQNAATFKKRNDIRKDTLHHVHSAGRGRTPDMRG